MSKAEIIAELPKLTTEELAEVQARLDELAARAPELEKAIAATHQAWGGKPGPENRAADYPEVSVRQTLVKTIARLEQPTPPAASAE